MTKPSDLRQTKRKRLDQLLTEAGLADSIPSARALILAGQVVVNEQRADKPGSLYSIKSEIRLKKQGLFVSRGGEKLWSAIRQLGLSQSFQDTLVFDLGASTGGFTDCVLQAGARQVIAVDIGAAQLAWRLLQDPRVISVEKTDLRDFSASAYGCPDWIVADLGFIRLSLVAGHISALSGSGSRLLAMVKPQFELPQELVPSGGVVTDPALQQQALSQARYAFERCGFRFIASADSSIRGRRGNQETFLYMMKEAEQEPCREAVTTEI
ncbi:MAG: TlyA family RNA methyltransferase [Deltaproteobacteria bacterium]|nr:TlyA family RNA methyltransferase [Deltaproteobacteria bacterium]